MGNLILVTRAAKQYGLETFDYDGDLWTESDSEFTTVSRYTSDPDRASVMKVIGDCITLGMGFTLGDGMELGDAVAGEGVYKDYAVAGGQVHNLTFFYRGDSGTLRFQAYDQSNGAEISHTDLTDATWTAYEKLITAPASCSTVRLKFIQEGNPAMAFLIDDVNFSGNAFAKDPDVYHRWPTVVRTFTQLAGGRRVSDKLTIHYDFDLQWNYLTADEYDDLRELLYANELLYFDDTDVPLVVETGTIRTNATYNFVGITNPSSTHKAYASILASVPSAEGGAETTEFSTADYQAVDADDANNKESDETLFTDYTARYIFHKFLLESGIATADVQRIRILVAALSDDESEDDDDGCILYAWNGANYVKLTSTSADAKTDLTYRQTGAVIAQSFVDSVDDYVRLLLRTRKASPNQSESVEVAAGGAILYALLEYNSKLYGVGEARILYEWSGSAWLSKAGSSANNHLYAALVFGGALYAGGVEQKLNEWDDASAWADKSAAIGNTITALGEYNSTLYAGDNAGGLWEWNGVDTLADESTGGDANAQLYFIGELDGELVCADLNGEVYTWDDVDTLTSEGDFNESVRFNGWCIHDGKLYGAGYTTGRLWEWDGAASLTNVAPQFEAEGVYAIYSDGTTLFGVTRFGKVLEFTGEAWIAVTANDAEDSLLTYCLAGFDSKTYFAYKILYELQAAGPLNLKSYYAEVEINEDLDNVIELSHRAKLDGGNDVIWVKNLTQVTTLELTTNYTIAADRRSITVSSGATDGDVIEVKYDRYFEVTYDALPEILLVGEPGSARRRRVTLRLSTLTGSE